jgi:ABC-type multidrug transport system fused ATPase/permease subunit
MGNTFKNFFRCVAEIGEVVAIIDTPHSVQDTTTKKLKVKEGEIEFQEVEFSYDGKNKVFDQLSLKIKPGERIGLVGPS